MVHWIFLVRSQQISCDIRKLVCRGKKNGKIKIVSSFSAIKLYFVVNVLINKTIVLLNLAEFHLVLATSAYGLVGLVSGDIPCDFAG